MTTLPASRQTESFKSIGNVDVGIAIRTGGLLLSLGLMLGVGVNDAVGQTPSLVEFMVGDTPKRGLRLADSATESVIIGRDGWLHAIRSTSASVRPIAGDYRPISAPELRNELRAEFGPTFEVVTTSNFLIVQPRGRGHTWPDLFEQCHRSFADYMGKRGVKLREGRFPMVAIVFPDSRSMYDEFGRLGIEASRVAGLYSNSSNRVMTHDGGRRSMIATTVRHEAAHQSAFNSGVHSRVNETPKWITEGIGQMFEPASMGDRRHGVRRIDRVNPDSVRVLRRIVAERGTSGLVADVARLIRDDHLFEDPARIEDAYSLAWAMMFYLGERRPDVFADVLNFTATRPPFTVYTPGQRGIDFERIAGEDPLAFGHRIARFAESLP